MEGSKAISMLRMLIWKTSRISIQHESSVNACLVSACECIIITLGNASGPIIMYTWQDYFGYYSDNVKNTTEYA